MTAEIKNAADVATFVKAGKATVTLSSKKTGARYTYRIVRTKNKPDVFFVGLLTGADNTKDFSYIGMCGGE